MAKFSYKGYTSTGEPLEGTMEAGSIEGVQESFRSQNAIILEVQEIRERSGLNITIGGERVKAKDVVVFARQLSVLIASTVPIVRALRILSKQTESKTLQRIVTEIADAVDGGARLSAAMHQHDTVFDDFFVHMIRAGETTGRLDEVLVYLADQKESDYQLMSKIIGSMIYPVFIIAVLIIIMIFMIIFVIPSLLDVVSQTGSELPFVTKILLGVSDLVQGYWWLGLLLVLFGTGAYLIGRRQPRGKEIIDQLKLRVPVLGRIFRNIYLARMSRSLSNLLASGVPVNRSIEIVSDIVGNSVYKKILTTARADIEGGSTLSNSLNKEEKFVPQMVTQMIAIGEETGRSDQILAKIADFYSNEVDSLTASLVSLIEPLIIIAIGGGAAVLVAGILLPIYQVTSAF